MTAVSRSKQRRLHMPHIPTEWASRPVRASLLGDPVYLNFWLSRLFSQTAQKAAQGGRAARERPRKTYGGVDVEGSTTEELYERAKELDIDGRSNMTKEELAEAIARRQ